MSETHQFLSATEYAAYAAARARNDASRARMKLLIAATRAEVRAIHAARQVSAGATPNSDVITILQYAPECDDIALAALESLSEEGSLIGAVDLA